LIPPAALLASSDAPDLVLLDARAGADAGAKFDDAHLRGARRIDLEGDLADVRDPALGGRHPLPSLSAWAATLGRLGVTRSSFVVIYDDAGGANAAARAWWMLRAVGHDHVAVLDGGFDAARRAGWPIERGSAATSFAPDYPVPSSWRLPTVDADEVEKRRHDEATRVIDARAAARYRGEAEPIDPVAGHVPGAVNLPFADQLTPDGTFESPSVLRAKYGALLGDRSPSSAIVYCGSGVTACHLLLGMAHAGLDLGALYVGSWGEWCRQPRPRAPSSS
jgi:thiosulfate/3-mercaptopyruvate sulfurtransferase